MSEERVLGTKELPEGAKKTIKIGDTEILLLHHEGAILAVEAKCPHAGAPLEEGAICNGRLVCPWHMGTFALPTGALIEPPPMAPLKTFTVRIEGEDIFVDPQPRSAQPAQPDAAKDARTFLLAGFGAAGAMAASTLRLEGFAGRIVAVDPVDDEPVDRTNLSKMALSGQFPLKTVQIGTQKDAQVERIVASISELSSARKECRLSNGESIHFDAALVATGGTPKRLGVPGAERAFTIRHTGDVRKILKKAEGARNAVVIGTSFIGLEAASALTEKGLHVTVAGPQELPFIKHFGERIARALKDLHARKGTDFRLGVEIISIGADGVHVRANEGEHTSFVIPADLVMMGVGIEPALEFDHDLPLAENGGIAVSNDLRVADGVWVAGDIASVAGRRIEHWRLAEQHGHIAARQMLGKTDRYAGVPFFWTYHFGKRIDYLGHADEWDDIVYDGAVEKLAFLAYYLKDCKVAAVVSCERETDTAKLAEVMRSRPTLEEARRAIAR